VIATKNRRKLFERALRYFQAQTLEDRELIVVDDGSDSVEDLCAPAANVRYLRTEPLPLGTKMNLGFEAARGDRFQKLDDDDFYHPDFLRASAATFESAGGEEVIVAWDCFLLWTSGDDRLRFSGFNRQAGSTLGFPRAVWERTKFRDIPKSVDSRFLEDAQTTVLGVRAPEMHVVFRHGANTWNQLRSGKPTDDWARSRPEYPKTLEEVVGEEAARFYREYADSDGI